MLCNYENKQLTSKSKAVTVKEALKKRKKRFKKQSKPK